MKHMDRHRVVPGKRALAALGLMLALFLSGCAGDAQVKRQLFALDTLIELTAYGDQAEAGLDAATELLFEMDAMLDVYDENSELSQLNAAGGSSALSPALLELWEDAETMYAATGGVFDPSIQPVIALWGFGTENPAQPADADLAAALELVGFSRVERSGSAVRLPEGMQVSFGAIAKGYIGQKMSETLQDAGVESAILSLGGNVQTLGLHPDGSPWQVALLDPKDTGSAAGILTVGAGTAVVTSGGYQRYFEENGMIYHHILDPETGYPADSGLLSVTVVCADGAAADALSTALFILGEDGALRHRAESAISYDLVLITQDGRVVVTGELDFHLEGGAYTYEHVD